MKDYAGYNRHLVKEYLPLSIMQESAETSIDTTLQRIAGSSIGRYSFVQGFPTIFPEYQTDVERLVDDHPRTPFLRSLQSFLEAEVHQSSPALEDFQPLLRTSQASIRGVAKDVANYVWFNAARSIAKKNRLHYPQIAELWKHHFGLPTHETQRNTRTPSDH